MERRRAFAFFFLLSLFVHLKDVIQYGPPDYSLLLEPFVIMWAAAAFPGGLIGVFLHTLTGVTISPATVIAIALLFWFFPVARVQRWAGTFDAFARTNRARSRVLGFAAAVLDANDRRKFGTTKTGGWA
jgi:hypothetical protein